MTEKPPQHELMPLKPSNLVHTPKHLS